MIQFLGATKHLYNWLCLLVGRSVEFGRSVGNAFVRRSTRRTLLSYLALLFTMPFLEVIPVIDKHWWLKLFKNQNILKKKVLEKFFLGKIKWDG